MRAAGVTAVVLGALFIVAGALHFIIAGFYLRMMPPALPAHLLLVQISGVCEMLGGIGMTIAATRRAAAIGLIALLVAVFPANVYMALHPDLFRDIGPAIALYVRLPLQFVLIYLVWWAGARVVTR